jgi:hypothetical protein
MDDELKEVHIFYLDMILQEIAVQRAAVMVSAAAVSVSASVSATTVAIWVDNNFDTERTTQ